MATTHDMTHTHHATEDSLGKRLETLGWGLVFIWLGSTFLAGFAGPMVLLGLGVIALAVQAARYVNHLPAEGFWLLVGAIFVVTGLWGIFGTVQALLVPIALIAAGVILIGRLFWPRRMGSA